MRVTIDETARRRAIQSEYNVVHGITPETIKKRIHDLEHQIAEADYLDWGIAAEDEESYGDEAKLETNDPTIGQGNEVGSQSIGV